MFRFFDPERPVRPSDRMAHDVVDGLVGSDVIRRVLVVGDESERVANVLRNRLSGSVVVAVHAVDALDGWGDWADLVVSAWTGGVDATGLAIKLRSVTPQGARVAVMDQGAIELIDALNHEFRAQEWTIESPPTGGQPVLRFVGTAAA